MARMEATPGVRYLDTATAYDLWSQVYDTDGNFLQALDTIEMRELLPKLLRNIQSSKPWKIVDLGCGTGRNTMALLQVEEAEVTALDLSPRMLDVARQRLQEVVKQCEPQTRLNLDVFDMLHALTIPTTAQDADAIVSTLVVEHVPLKVFFDTAARMLRPGGMLLVTNMHSDMGQISQAGFVDPKTGEKVRPTSYAHTKDELLSEGFRQDFEIVGEVLERTVDTELAAQLGPRAGKWIGVTVWIGCMFRRKA